MEYKLGDRVRIKSLDWYHHNKDTFGSVCVGDKKPKFTYGMSKYCGLVLTIVDHSEYEGEYYMIEDDGVYTWTDEMFEGFVEEEAKPKYEDEVSGEYYSTPKYLVRPSGYQFVDENGNVINARKIVLKKLVVPKFKKGDKIKDKNNRVWYVVQVGNRHFDISRIPNPKGEGTGYFVPMEDQDDYELLPDKELPKTYEECCEVLGCKADHFFTDFSYKGCDVEISDYEDKIDDLLQTFRKLRYCRDAYWKIAGEEMGLGKPWEPDWEDYEHKKFVLVVEGNTLIKKEYSIQSCVLAFPTEEMRDAFYENFKELIEQCKELL